MPNNWLEYRKTRSGKIFQHGRDNSEYLVYFNENQSMLRIKHYVSDTNVDYRDVPNKFSEAVNKLVPDVKSGVIEETEGIRHLMQQAHDGTFPGLATVKRWSIMHHLELMGRYLDNK